METDQIVRLVVGLGIMAVSLAISGKRVLFLYKLIRLGQASPGPWTARASASGCRSARSSGSPGC